MRPNGKQMRRREALALLAAAPIASAFACNGAEVARAQRAIAGAYVPRFFTESEYETVRVLVDILIPKDARSGSATDAGVPQFMDFLMDDQPERRTPMRGGLSWLDAECQVRFDRTFLDCDPSERSGLLDEIAHPERARDELSHGVSFFNRFRDLTATGFFSSKMGVADLRYMGNEHVTEWTGCPQEQLDKLGLS